MPDRKPFRTTRALVNLRQGRNDWYRIKNLADGPSQLHIYDEIGYFGVTASDMIADLSNVKGDLEVHLNTPGGEVFDGIAIFNALKQRDGVVRVVIDSLAASIGSVIAMAADPGNLIISKNASLMIHDGFGMGIGNAKDLRELADLLDKTSDNIASIYADRTGQPAAQWREAMLAETWYVGQEAVDAGLADFVQGAEPAEPAAVKIAATWDLSIFAKRPGQPRAAAPEGDEANADDPNADSPEPWDPDGNGDDDSTPEGDTDHSHWAPDGTQLKPVPGKPMTGPDGQVHYARAGAAIRDAVAVHEPFSGAHAHPHAAMDGTMHEHEHTHDGDASHDHGHGQVTARAVPLLLGEVDNSPWDAAKAWHNGATADDPAAFYKGICAGRKEGDPSKQSSWALPYKYHPGDGPNAAGVRNALSRLPQTEGLTNKAEAQALLERLMKQINPDYESSQDRAPDAFVALDEQIFENIRAALEDAR